MNRATPSPKHRDLVLRLIAFEAIADGVPGSNPPAAFRVVEKLRVPLSRMAGRVAFQALLTAALRQTKARVPDFQGVQINGEGLLEGGSGIANQDRMAEAGVLLISQLLGLLTELIGEAMTLKILFAVWPDFTVLPKEAERVINHEPAK